MTIYNDNRTAYKRDWSEHWYLVPDGKKRAPIFWLGDGPLLPLGRYSAITDEHINLITQKDRVILLESISAGCFDQMWDEMKDVLLERSRKNFKTLRRFIDERKNR